MSNKTSLVRKLIPKSYHFDGYNEINCPNSRDKPFFSENVIPMGDYFLTIRLVNQNMISLEYASTCAKGKIVFMPYMLTLDTYVSKLQKAIQDGADFITFEIQPQYDCNTNICNRCSEKSNDCSQLWKNRPNQVIAAVSFNSAEIRKALAMYFEITKNTGGKTIMTTTKKNNNFFGMNFELGLSKDRNIAATLMGVAVRNPANGNWYTFDSATNSRKNIANFTMGSFPIFLLPVKKLEIGDLIKKDGKYYYVKAINANNTFTLLSATDGMICEMLAEESIIPGMTMYTKVVAFDTKTLTDTSSKEGMGSNVLAAICMMQWAKGNEDDFSLDNIDDDSFNGLGSCLPVIMAMNGGNMGDMFTDMNNLPMILALGSGSGNSDANNMTQMLVLSQLLGGNSSPIPGLSSTPTTSEPATTEKKVACEKCQATYPEGTNFCPKCGGKTKSLATSCRKCGATLMSDAMFCHVCGEKVSPDTCPKCGRTVENAENFCSKCGANLKAPVNPEPTVTATTVTPDSTPATVAPVSTSDSDAESPKE